MDKFLRRYIVIKKNLNSLHGEKITYTKTIYFIYYQRIYWEPANVSLTKIYYSIL